MPVRRNESTPRRPGAARLAPVTALLLCFAVASAAGAQQLIVYPSQGQTPEQQARDQSECHTWAVQQTGYDPASPSPPPTTSAAPAPQGGVLRGAARGALVGVTVGAIAGDAGKGAAAGAAGGALIGGFRKRDQRRAYEQQQAQAQAQYQQQQANRNQTYNRALSACLQGRGYTVN